MYFRSGRGLKLNPANFPPTHTHNLSEAPHEIGNPLPPICGGGRQAVLKWSCKFIIFLPLSMMVVRIEKRAAAATGTRGRESNCGAVRANETKGRLISFSSDPGEMASFLLPPPPVLLVSTGTRRTTLPRCHGHGFHFPFAFFVRMPLVVPNRPISSCFGN